METLEPRLLLNASLLQQVLLVGGLDATEDATVSAPLQVQTLAATLTVTPGDDLRAIVESAPDGSTIVLSAGTHHLSAQGPFNQGVLIQNTRNLTITGQGRAATKIKLAANVHFGFYIGSNVENLRIEKMHIEGTTPLAVNTHAIGNFSGTTNVRNVLYTRLRVDHVAVGIAADTFDGGVYDGVTITRNIIANTQGTSAGWGYGIEMTNARNVRVARNRIENATRHSIYVARSAPGSNITIERNVIDRHDRNGIQPRWFAAALAVSRASDVRVAHNVLIDPRTIGISVESDEIQGQVSRDIKLVNNQVIGAHYVGIWVTTGQTHTSFANVVVPQPVNATPNAPWHEPISTFDFPRGVPTASRLVAPLPRWEQLDSSAELDGKIYTLKNGIVDRVTPYTWSYQTAPTTWPTSTAMSAVSNALGQGQGRLYVADQAGIHEVDPNNWSANTRPGDWRGARFMAATADQVYLMKNDVLYRLTPGSLALERSTQDWSNTRWMWESNGQIQVFKGSSYHVVDTNAFVDEGGVNQAPTRPGVPSASAVSSDRATIRWPVSTDPDGDALTYAVRYRKTDLSTSWSSVVHTSNTQVSITGLDPDTSYNVSLRASDGQLTSTWRWATNLFTTSGSGTGAWPYVEDFDDGQARDFVPQTGAWSVNNGWYELQEASNDAVSVLTPPEPLPADFQIDATLSVQAGGSWKNAYVVFDHEGPRNFKVAAVVAGSNRLRLGHATPAGFEWDTTVSRRVDLDTPYGVRVEISGSVTTLSVDGAALLTHDYGEVLSDGDLGLGSRRSHARFDNVVVQPTNQTIHSDDFEDGVAELFTPEVGTWSVVGGSYQVQTQNEDTMSVLNLGGPGALPGDFDLDVTLSVQSGGDWKNAYVIFDRVDATNYKIAAAVAGSNRWRLGQRTSSGLVWHQTLIQAITLDTNYQVRLSVRGSTAALSVDGAVLVAHDYGEPLSDGALALASRRSHARFDDLIVSA